MATPFRISEVAKTADGLAALPQLSDIQLQAWLTVPLYRRIYTGAPATHPAIRQVIGARHEASLLHDPACHFLVASADTGGAEAWQPVSFIKYHVFPTAEAALARTDASTTRRWDVTTNTEGEKKEGGGEQDGEAGINKALIAPFWAALARVRQHHSSAYGAHVSIDILATRPAYHGRGAGRLLLTRVLDQVADRLGLVSVIEASQEGQRLYRSVGFAEEDAGRWNVHVDLGRWLLDGTDRGADWRDRKAEGEHDPGWYTQVVMVRPAREHK